MIDLKDIVVRFGDFEALHRINVNVKEGEFFTFLGPSGCGKTTTLRTITGFIDPAEGVVSMQGKDITHVPIEKRNIGIVFQSYALFPTMTVRDNIAFGLKIKKLKKDEIDRKVREIAAKVDLTEEQLAKAVRRSSWPKRFPSFPAVSSSAWRSRARWSRGLRSSVWTNRSPTWTRSCV